MIQAVTIFHYHLLPGGVTSVISLACEALARYMPELKKITLATGTRENLPETAEAIRKNIAGFNLKLNTAVLEEIGYVSGMPSAPSVKEIKHHLQHFAGSLWWIHNYHLGKNPQFTQALLELLEENPHQQVLFHIHDFPECARYENLQRLKSNLTKNPYPRGRNVRYALINRRDLNLMIQSGLPREDLFLLNNPVRKSSPADSEPPDTGKIRRILSEKFPDRGCYTPEGLHLFYPVRTIRRKNILEAGVWTRLAGAYSSEPVNLIVTLPGVSTAERHYSDTVEQIFREGLIPGLWGIGRHLDAAGVSFTGLGKSCDMMVASSVQEGFGYLFVEALQWGLPLFARDLDILEGIRDLFDPVSSRFYSELKIPASPARAEKLRIQYRQKLERTAEHLPPEAGEVLEREIEQTGKEGNIDFSLLSVSEQTEVLQQLESPGFLEETLMLNQKGLADFNEILGNSPDSAMVKRAEEQFSFNNFAKKTGEIFQSYQEAGQRGPAQQESPQTSLIEAFARLKFMLLLYDYNGET